MIRKKIDFVLDTKCQLLAWPDFLSHDYLFTLGKKAADSSVVLRKRARFNKKSLRHC